MLPIVTDGNHLNSWNLFQFPCVLFLISTGHQVSEVWIVRQVIEHNQGRRAWKPQPSCYNNSDYILLFLHTLQIMNANSMVQARKKAMSH